MRYRAAAALALLLALAGIAYGYVTTRPGVVESSRSWT